MTTRFPMFGRRCIAALVLLLAACVCVDAAADGTAGSGLFQQRAWSAEQGAPADVWALAQDRDGFLWLGTGTGLFRFDGVAFERVEPAGGDAFRSNSMTALRIAPDGTLWVGFFYGGVAALKDGRLRHYGVREGVPDGMVIALAQTRDGALWAATRGGLVRFDSERWHAVGAERGYTANRADWVFVDRDGALWVTDGERLVVLRAGAERFAPTAIAVGKDAVLAQAPDGRLWLSDDQHGTRVLPSDASAPTDVPRTTFASAKRLLFDRRGQLWGTDASRGGVYRVARPDRVATGRALSPADVDDAFDRRGGLTSDIAVPLLEDVEGTVWVGTNLGLDSVRANSVIAPDALKVGAAANAALAPDRDGAVWIALGGALRRVTPDANVVVADGLPDIHSLVHGADDVLWLEARDGLLRLRDGAIEKVPVPALVATDNIRALASDGDGGLWAGISNRGLHRYRDGAWTSVDLGAAFAARTPLVLATDGDGRLWAGYRDDTLLALDGDRVRVLGAADGLDVGPVTALAIGARDRLVGGEHGVARLRGDRFEPLGLADPDVLVGISGIVQTAAGDLWLNASRGVVHVGAAEAERAFAERGYRAVYRVFDFRDGLRGVARQSAPTTTAVADSAQRIWFVTNQGVAWLDPSSVGTNGVRPTVTIRALVAGDVRHRPIDGLRLPQKTGSVRFDYTATSLAVPERVAFRYRLDGVDATWQDAGARRDAFYTNLAPGSYRFRVVAANDDGVWNDAGAAVDFSIAPQFFQTPWFYALCTLAAVVLVASLYAWRLRLASERIQLRFAARVGERERIARELHDTLLQGVQGLLLRLQALAAGMPADDPRRSALDGAVEQARVMLVEGRDKIVALRGAEPVGDSLVAAIRKLGAEMASAHPAAFRLAVHGTERALCPPACEEVLDIVREGLRNAFVHADAAAIDVAVTFERRALRVRIRDDGKGIDETTLKHGRRDGHWGLVGMRERANRLGAAFAVRRVAPSGTEVSLSFPGHIVFGPLRDSFGPLDE